MDQEKINEIARELELLTEYKTIRLKDKQVVGVREQVDALHARIIKVAYDAGYRDGLAKRGEK